MHLIKEKKAFFILKCIDKLSPERKNDESSEKKAYAEHHKQAVA